MNNIYVLKNFARTAANMGSRISPADIRPKVSLSAEDLAEMMEPGVPQAQRNRVPLFCTNDAVGG